MNIWAYHDGVRLDFSRPGKPMDDSFVATFNGSLRDECLNVNRFASMAEAQGPLEAWRQDYGWLEESKRITAQVPDFYRRSLGSGESGLTRFAIEFAAGSDGNAIRAW